MTEFLLTGMTITVIVLLVLAILTVSKSIVMVRQGYEYTIERFGRFTRSMRPGIHFLIPYIERIGARVNMMERVLEVRHRMSLLVTMPWSVSMESFFFRCWMPPRPVMR